MTYAEASCSTTATENVLSNRCPMVKSIRLNKLVINVINAQILQQLTWYSITDASGDQEARERSASIRHQTVHLLRASRTGLCEVSCCISCYYTFLLFSSFCFHVLLSVFRHAWYTCQIYLSNIVFHHLSDVIIHIPHIGQTVGESFFLFSYSL